ELLGRAGFGHETVAMTRRCRSRPQATRSPQAQEALPTRPETFAAGLPFTYLRIINCRPLAAENFVPTYAALRSVHYHEQTAVATRRNRYGAAQLPQSGRCYPRLPEKSRR